MKITCAYITYCQRGPSLSCSATSCRRKIGRSNLSSGLLLREQRGTQNGRWRGATRAATDAARQCAPRQSTFDFVNRLIAGKELTKTFEDLAYIQHRLKRNIRTTEKTYSRLAQHYFIEKKVWSESFALLSLPSSVIS